MKKRYKESKSHEAAESKEFEAGEKEGMKEASKRKKRKPKLGSGARFKQLKGKLSAKGAKNPGALAAYIGRKKYGKAKFQKLAAKGKKRSPALNPMMGIQPMPRQVMPMKTSSKLQKAMKGLMRK